MSDGLRGLRVLFVSPAMPYPPSWGFGQRVYGILRQVAKRHDVTLLAYARGQEMRQAEALQKIGIRVCTVPLEPHGRVQRRTRQFASLLSPVPYHYRSLHTLPMQRAIDQVSRDGAFDLIQVESSQLAEFDFDRATPLLLDEHNLEFELLRRVASTEHSPARRLFNWIEYFKVRAREHRAWTRFDGCALTSEREAAVVRGLRPSTATAVIPNGVDLERFVPADDPVQTDDLVFNGLLTYRPNTDAVAYFAQDVLPLIRRTRPTVTFTVVGHLPPGGVAGLEAPGVTATGWVADIRPHLARSAAVVVPLRMGGGTRLKVVEALAMGKAVISSTVGCEGIDVIPDCHLLTADDPHSFAEAVLRILEDRDLARQLGREGRSLVERSYGWPAVVDRLETFYGELLESPLSRPASGGALL